MIMTETSIFSKSKKYEPGMIQNLNYADSSLDSTTTPVTYWARNQYLYLFIVNFLTHIRGPSQRHYTLHPPSMFRLHCIQNIPITISKMSAEQDSNSSQPLTYSQPIYQRGPQKRWWSRIKGLFLELKIKNISENKVKLSYNRQRIQSTLGFIMLGKSRE